MNLRHRFQIGFGSVLLITTLLLPRSAGGHAGERHAVEAINAQIKDHGETAELLMRRARSFHILGAIQEERADLDRVIQWYPDFRPARIAMAQFHLDRQDFKKALDLATALLEKWPDASDVGTVHVVCGDAYILAGRPSAAVTSYERALEYSQDEVEWHLKRSEALAKLARHRDRAVALQTARVKLPSIVLELEWVDALIECNDAESARMAMTIIEPKLARSRLRSSWLMRRARVYLVLDQHASARIDLAEALRELDNRIAVQHPDPSLLVDRAYVFALQGENLRAEQDLDAAKQHGALGRRADRVQRAISDISAADKSVD